MYQFVVANTWSSVVFQFKFELVNAIFGSFQIKNTHTKKQGLNSFVFLHFLSLFVLQNKADIDQLPADFKLHDIQTPSFSSILLINFSNFIDSFKISPCIRFYK